jgi:hypothetical protein
MVCSEGLTVCIMQYVYWSKYVESIVITEAVSEVIRPSPKELVSLTSVINKGAF